MKQNGSCISFFFKKMIYLAALGLIHGMKLQHVGSSSLTKDQALVSCLGGLES